MVGKGRVGSVEQVGVFVLVVLVVAFAVGWMLGMEFFFQCIDLVIGSPCPVTARSLHRVHRSAVV